MTATPGDVGPGYVVRWRCGGGGLTYSSLRMTKDQAEAAADDYESVLARANPNELVRFTSEYGVARIRAKRVTAIEVVRTLLAPHRHIPTPVPNGVEVETR